MRYWTFLVAILIIFIGRSDTIGAQEGSAFGGFRIAGYLPDYRFAELDLQATMECTDLIIFSAEVQAEGGLDLKRLDKCPWDKLLAFKTKYRKRLFLTVGGWERSSHFASVASDEQRRKRLVKSVVQIALEKRLDGIDLDWEHPKDEKEERLYGELLTDLRDGLAPHGLLLTVTIAGWQALPAKAIAAVDAVQLMAYDDDGEHSTFENSQQSLQRLLSSGVPANKIVLGLPFYGRDIGTREAMTYRQIVANAGGKRSVLDGDRMGPIYFNGPKTISLKTRFAIKSHCAGVMVWEMGQDSVGDHSLAKVIATVVHFETKQGTAETKQPRE